MTVLAALADDQSAQPVLETATAFAALVGASVRALHVREADVEPSGALTRLAGVGLRTVTGSPTQQIVSAAGDPGITVVVIGARSGRVGLESPGHTAIEVISRIPTPVIVVSPAAHPPAEIRHILLPVEGTTGGPAILGDAVTPADGQTLEITVLNVSTPRTVQAFSDHAPHARRAWEREFLARHLPVAHGPVTVERRHGNPADQIVTAAQESASDLIVLTWSQNLSPGHARVVSETLTRTAVPVLLLRASRAPRHPLV